MKNSLLSFILSFLIGYLISGCSIHSRERLNSIDNRMGEISARTHLLEKRLDDLSRTISLIVKDGNRLHSSMEEIYTKYKETYQNTERLETSMEKLDRLIQEQGSYYKAMEETLNKRIENIQKAELELLNKLEILKAGMEIESKSTGSIQKQHNTISQE